jgi:hypothetical protein
VRRGRRELGQERRNERVEINLAAEEETGRRPIRGARRGCALPFGIWFVAVGALIAAHAAFGTF